MCGGRGGEQRGQEARGECEKAHAAGGRRGGGRTHILHEKGASGIKHELVGVKHVPTVRLQLDVTQVWVINHGSEVGQQQAEGELEGGEHTGLTASSPTSGVLASFSNSPLH